MAFGSILLAAIGIGLLIFIHELGHFLAARAAGVKVEVFSLGFGPRLGGVVWRGTDFRISAVPFGGFVMVAGQDPNDHRYPPEVSLHSKSVGQRALFWSGGVIMNVLFALIVFPIVFGAGVQFEAPIVGSVAPGTAAWEVDLQRGERVLEVAGKEIYSASNMRMEVALNGNRPVELLVEGADGQRRVVTARPQYSKATGLYELGVLPAIDSDSVVLTVDAEGPAATAGLQTGDRVLTIDGKPFGNGWSNGMAPLTVRVERDGAVHEAVVIPKGTTKGQPAMIGVSPLANRIAGFRAGCALIDRLGLQRGDRLLAIDGRPFLTGDLRDFVDGPAELRVTVRREDEELTLSVATNAEERAALVEHLAFGGDMRLQVRPASDGAALAAGMQSGDWIQSVNGALIKDWDALRESVRKAGEKPLVVRLLRPDPNEVVAGLHRATGTPVEITITPKMQPAADYGWDLEVAAMMVEIKADGIGDAVRQGAVCSLDLVKQLYVTLKRLMTGEVGAKNLGGIIRISEVSYQAAQRGWTWLGYFLSLLSLNLAFVNLLPIPVLDGGHLMFILIEKVKGSPVSTKVFGYSQVIGLVFVLLLVLFVTYNDILRLL